MKINLEVELSPEELRRLVGLPDMQPFWDGVQDRIMEGDTEMVQQLAKTALSEGMKTIDLSTRILKNLSGLVRRGDQDQDSSQDDTANTRKTTSTRRRSSAKSTRSKSTTKS